MSYFQQCRFEWLEVGNPHVQLCAGDDQVKITKDPHAFNCKRESGALPIAPAFPRGRIGRDDAHQTLRFVQEGGGTTQNVEFATLRFGIHESTLTPNSRTSPGGKLRRGPTTRPKCRHMHPRTNSFRPLAALCQGVAESTRSRATHLRILGTSSEEGI
eukprot:m.418499 g.418499  ORF g.418499 m.418499 type:complete len:158 (-) comp16834_c1_seq2:1076-1549(-)